MNRLFEYKGNLLLSDCNIILHQCNCQSTMGAGIAKQIAKQYPEAYRADRQYKIGRPAIEKLGDYSWARGKDGRVVINLYGQYKYGRGIQTDYAALQQALHSAFEWINRNITNPKVGLPKYMGCNLAGGNWEIVRNIIDHLSAYHQLPVHIYELER